MCLCCQTLAASNLVAPSSKPTCEVKCLTRLEGRGCAVVRVVPAPRASTSAKCTAKAALFLGYSKAHRAHCRGRIAHSMLSRLFAQLSGQTPAHFLTLQGPCGAQACSGMAVPHSMTGCAWSITLPPPVFAPAIACTSSGCLAELPCPPQPWGWSRAPSGPTAFKSSHCHDTICCQQIVSSAGACK